MKRKWLRIYFPPVKQFIFYKFPLLFSPNFQTRCKIEIVIVFSSSLLILLYNCFRYSRRLATAENWFSHIITGLQIKALTNMLYPKLSQQYLKSKSFPIITGGWKAAERKCWTSLYYYYYSLHHGRPEHNNIQNILYTAC